MYLAKSYQDYILQTGQDIYGSKKLVLPKPEIYVIYTGSRKARPKTISFAKEFFPDEDCCLDVAVHMIYDGEKGDIINQYVTFTKIFDEQVKKYGLTVQAVREVIRMCKDRDVLKQYLSGRESEVVDLMLTLFSQEEIWDMHIKSEKKKAAEKAAKKAAIRTTIEEGRHFGASREVTAERIREKFNISKDDAEHMIKIYW
ncbi:MAG: hypothetical protein HFH34_08020 [Eubacterium sp.]|nr:hypothetical protein [Eubacterium sp.]